MRTREEIYSEMHSYNPRTSSGQLANILLTQIELLADIRDLLQKPLERKSEMCPPHNMQAYHYTGGWSSTMPPPKQQCTKCLMTI